MSAKILPLQKQETTLFLFRLKSFSVVLILYNTNILSTLFSLSPAYKVIQRGQMHVRHLRELATKLSGLQCENAELMNYFTVKIQTLCKMALRDCCMELEGSVEGVERAALSTNPVGYLEIHRAIPKDIAQKYQQVCSSSEESIIKIFLAIVPNLIQSIKEIFVDENISEEQNGLRGLAEDTLEQFLSNVRDAEKNIRIRQLVRVVCRILERLCLENCGKQPTTKIVNWGETLAIPSMLSFLEPFSQNHKQGIRLHKRLELFSKRLTDIISDQVDTADKVFIRDISNLTLSLIHFAKFSPSKLVRFELTSSTNSSVTCDSENNNDNVHYDKRHETFSQWFEIRKESEDELRLHANALVHVDGRICKKVAFQSVITINASAEEAFDACMTNFIDVTAMKLKDNDSQNLRVVLCSTQKEKVTEVLEVLKRKLSEEVVNFRQSEVTQCHLKIRSITSEAETFLSLRLFYKWGSDVVGLDSKDFVNLADSSVGRTCTPEVQFVGKIKLLVI